MIQWLNQQKDVWEGSFQSEFFRNEANQPELFVSMPQPCQASYAEKCIKHFNALTSASLKKICQGFVKIAKNNGLEEFFSDPRDILDYCWLTTLVIIPPESSTDISYILQGEGDWGSSIQAEIRNGKISSIGE